MREAKCDLDCKWFRADISGNGKTEPRLEEFYCEPDNLDDEEIEEIWNKYLEPEIKCNECPGFKPIKVEKCNECGKIINKMTYEIDYMSYVYDPAYFCSEGCKIKYDQEVII